ncbi:T9SS type A sorting domain-containing protein [Bacteroides sp.]|uniref:T9SS type A sorting domain-containing protein n=1 Tax=Bacteroides sp. TaxID=29523 RepID=UPI0025C24C5E|nr:T9SS type A sorting domain-containing protein [Bacteroides sp.]
MKNNKRTFKRIATIFLLSGIFSMWVSLDLCAQQRIKYIYDSAGNRLSRQKEIVVQTRGALSDEEEPSVYEEELSETKVTIYPNPTRSMLKIDISGVEKFENARISLYDLTGKLLQQWAEISQSNAIDLSERTPGMYIMQVAYNGKISSWKIIKE